MDGIRKLSQWSRWTHLEEAGSSPFARDLPILNLVGNLLKQNRIKNRSALLAAILKGLALWAGGKELSRFLEGKEDEFCTWGRCSNATPCRDLKPLAASRTTNESDRFVK